jgi:hypothetical protein
MLGRPTQEIAHRGMRIMGIITYVTTGGSDMSRKYSRGNNKHFKNPKVNFQQYMYNENEPRDEDFDYSLEGLDMHFPENIYSTRHEIRRMAKRLRNGKR